MTQEYESMTVIPFLVHVPRLWFLETRGWLMEAVVMDIEFKVAS